MKGYTLILGSNSPRRAELLTLTGIPYIKRVIDIDESIAADIPVQKVALAIAQKKAAAHIDTIAENEIILTADTVVVHNNTIYGKPQNNDQAIDFLMQLSGSCHEVYTGVYLLSRKKSYGFDAVSKVFFESLCLDEARYYVEQYQPLDKAGAYGIQDWIGYAKIEKIEGSYQNIIGLPTAMLYKELHAFLEDE